MYTVVNPILCCQTGPLESQLQQQLGGLNYVPCHTPKTPKRLKPEETEETEQREEAEKRQKQKDGKEEKGEKESRGEREESGTKEALEVFGELKYPEGVNFLPFRLTTCGVYVIRSTELDQHRMAQVQLLTPFCFRNWRRNETVQFCQTKGLTFGEQNMWFTSETVTQEECSPDRVKVRSPFNPRGMTLRTVCAKFEFTPDPQGATLQWCKKVLTPPECCCPFVPTVRVLCTCSRCRLLPIPPWRKQLQFSWDPLEQNWVVQHHKIRAIHYTFQSSSPYLLFYSQSQGLNHSIIRHLGWSTRPMCPGN